MDYQKFLNDLTQIIPKIVEETLDKTLDEKLDRRFVEFEARMDEKLDRRFAEFEARMDEKLDRRFAEFEVRMDHKLDVKLAPITQSLEELKKSNAEDHRRLEHAIIKVDQKVDRLYNVFNLANALLQKDKSDDIREILNPQPAMT